MLPLSQDGTTSTGLKTPVFCGKGGYQLNHQCVNSFSKVLKVTDVCLYEEEEEKKKSRTPGLNM